MKKSSILKKAHSIKTQFFLFCIGLFLAISIFTSALIFQSNQAILQNNLEQAYAASEDFHSEITMISQQLTSIFVNFQYNQNCQSFLSAQTYRNIDANLINQIHAMIISSTLTSEAIADIAFVNDLLHWSKIYPKEDLMQMKKSLQSYTDVATMGFQTPSVIRPSQTYYVFGYNYRYHSEILGSIFISINMQSPFFRSISSPMEGLSFYLVDSNKNFYPFYADQKSQSIIAQNSCNLVDNLFKKEERKKFENLPFHIENYIVTGKYLEETRSVLLAVVDTKKATQTLNPIYRAGWIMLLIFFLLFLAFSIIFYCKFISPLDQFSHFIKEIKDPQLHKLEDLPILKGCTEIQQLEENFFSMLQSLETLNNKILETTATLYATELQRKNAEISALRSQINPHFLYNTLELIRSCALREDCKSIIPITTSMGKLYRYSIKGKPIVPLSQELDIVQSYLNIQQARFRNKITIIYNIPPELQSVPVIKMMLQPLVENAVTHGLESIDDSGILYIGARKDNNNLIITVRDNGIGISPDTMNKIREHLNANVLDAQMHLGLFNINARLRLHYGKEYGLEINSNPGDGTCVSVCLPIQNSSDN